MASSCNVGKGRVVIGSRTSMRTTRATTITATDAGRRRQKTTLSSWSFSSFNSLTSTPYSYSGLLAAAFIAVVVIVSAATGVAEAAAAAASFVVSSSSSLSSPYSTSLFGRRCQRFDSGPFLSSLTSRQESWSSSSSSSWSFSPRRSTSVVQHMSGVGGGVGDGRFPPPPPGGRGGNGNGNGGKGGLRDFLDADPEREPEDVQKVREALAEDSLPLSFGFEPPPGKKKREDEDDDDDDDDDTAEVVADLDGDTEKRNNDATSKGGDMIRLPGVIRGDNETKTKKKEEEEGVPALADNHYLEVVSQTSPSDLISKFTSTAHPRVQDAVRTTILGLVGNLPKLGFDSVTVTTGERLASLMFQLQMTGYMFKNAEYRLSLTQSLGMVKPPSSYTKLAKSGYLLEGTKNGNIDKALSNKMYEETSPVDRDDLEDVDALSKGKIRGKIRVRYGGTKINDEINGESLDVDKEKKRNDDDDDDGDDDDTNDEINTNEPSNTSSSLGEMEVEVDAEAYLSELRSEVTRLRDELSLTRKTKEDEYRKDLLLYIRTLSSDELRGLTSTMSPDVLSAMKGLVNVVMAGIGEGRIGPDTVTEQSGEAMAQLCMWQLVVGYNLRELEVREEMRAALGGGNNANGSKDVGGGSGSIIMEPGALE